VPHDDRLTETKRDRRRRDRRRMLRRLVRRNARFRDVYVTEPRLYVKGPVLSREEDDWRYAHRFYSARRQCRGPCCADPRRWYKRMTYKERRAEVDAQEQFEELGVKFKPSRFSWGW
jgi:hypothetical protein